MAAISEDQHSNMGLRQFDPARVNISIRPQRFLKAYGVTQPTKCGAQQRFLPQVIHNTDLKKKHKPRKYYPSCELLRKYSS
jgi:hypothetical protein